MLTDRDIKLVLGPEFRGPDEREHIGSAIATKNDKLVGIFIVTDACRVLALILEGHAEVADGVA